MCARMHRSSKRACTLGDLDLFIFNIEGRIFESGHENRKIYLYVNRNALNFSDRFMCAHMHRSKKRACTLYYLGLFIMTIEEGIFESSREYKGCPQKLFPLF